jgi:hypothetical protein
MAAKEKIAPIEAARGLGVDALIQVNSLERIEIRPGRDARFERHFYRAMANGQRADPAPVEPSRVQEFKDLIKPKEDSLGTGTRVGATINVTAVSVETGATIWFYEWTQVDEIGVDSEVAMLVDCEEPPCREIVRTASVASAGPADGSISGFSVAGDPADETQAIFHQLVRNLVTDLAERFAGRRS